MGNSTSTFAICEKEIDESTLERIRAAAPKDEDSGPSHSVDIPTLLQQIAVKQFPKNYGYGFTDPPEDAIDKSKIMQGLCSISTPVYDKTPGYMKKEVFSQLSLPGWLEGQVTSELVRALMGLVSDDKEPTWHVTPIGLYYDSPPMGPGDLKIDVLIVCVSGALTNDGLRAGISLIYYIGVFYHTKPDRILKYARDEIQGQAYLNAPKKTGDLIPKTDAELSDQLERYALSTFQTRFEFAYGSNPPGSWRAEGVSSAYLKSNQQLMYLPVMSPGRDYLRTSIENGLFAGLNVPIASVKRAAIDYSVELFDGLGDDMDWETSIIDHVYHPADPTQNPIHQKGIQLSWQNHQDVPGPDKRTVAVTYIFVQTMLYEEVPAEQRAMRYLFHLLCDKVRQELGKPPVAQDDLLTLKSILLEYARMKFQSTFHFAYAGEQSSPPARKPGGAVRGLCELLQTKNSSKQEVEDWLNSNVLEKDGRTFPKFANNQIWEKIRDDTVELTETRPDGSWYTDNNTAVYINPDGGTNIKQYSLYVYAAGKVTLGDVTVIRIFVCYLGIYCGTLETG
ncbi:hypothetical protein P691DRAFT_777621 [Macrolepiota fuliginosa MF-IS2]|uniref:Uncharacterized protein n=1 Tax=Macrolepiota fuliginosa MF-IS2 TaxID=1400762 RepID=A0A9P5X7A1_9AGAR|nr:hypothetical protein P691DRAFT_777621 [Macrolepiota fuliginosa MF-IS2]